MFQFGHLFSQADDCWRWCKSATVVHSPPVHSMWPAAAASRVQCDSVDTTGEKTEMHRLHEKKAGRSASSRRH